MLRNWLMLLSKISRAAWRPREEPMLQLEARGSLEAECLLPWVTVVFSPKAFN